MKDEVDWAGAGATGSGNETPPHPFSTDVRRRAALVTLPLLVPGVAAAFALHPPLESFYAATAADDRVARPALERIARDWHDGYSAMIVDMARLMRAPASRPGDPRDRARARLLDFLERRSGQRFGSDLRRWRQWMWSLPYEPHPEYAALKADLYGRIDPRMASFFTGPAARIRLDEIDWGGVQVDGIPPLDHPKTLRAAAARGMGDRDVVFGIALGGEARAYPKRILAWHELARDRLGGTELAVVYCTLCGTVIPYSAEVGDRRFTFGTSGLLYRSNKLMYDAETLSLWSSVEGRPVVGPLAGAPIELPFHPVVTTTWGEWRRRHPETTVLSFDTGHERDYSEGAAYRDYFATDALMFEVPRRDERLPNKAEVLTLILDAKDGGRTAVAIEAGFLLRSRVFALPASGHDLVVVTSPAGANRVYVAGGHRFELRGGNLVDERGLGWTVEERGLVPDGREEPALRRVPARRAFWFGWVAQFPDTRLFK